MRKTKLVVFDWNGTVLNDTEAAVSGFDKVLRELGDEREASAELHGEHFQVPVKEMYSSLGHVKLKPEAYVKLADAWEKEYWKLQPGSKLQEGVRESVEWLHMQRQRKIILSNYTITKIEKQLERFDLKFDAVLANEHYHESHDVGKLHRLHTYLAEHQLNPQTTIVIGDSTEEIQIAREIQGVSVAISNGWTIPARLKAEKPDYLIDSTELLALLKELVDAEL